MGEWKLVPVEPTPEMSAFKNTGVHFPLAERIYAAMLAAAPSPEWVKTSERLPTERDADEEYRVWTWCPELGVAHRWDGDGQCKECGNYATDLIDAALARQQPPEPPGGET